MVKIAFQPVSAQKPDKEIEVDKEDVHIPYPHVSNSFTLLMLLRVANPLL